jgi:hypothetical protein
MNKDLYAPHLKHYIRYEPSTGKFFWRISPGRGHPVGKEIGKSDVNSYKIISLRGKNFLAHRVAWLLYYGDWPDEIIDHINGDRSDNRIENLREASRSQNMANRGPRKGKKYKGVYQRGNRFQAYISKNRERKNLGWFSCEHEAAKAYNIAAKLLHGDYARLNEITET